MDSKDHVHMLLFLQWCFQGLCNSKLWDLPSSPIPQRHVHAYPPRKGLRTKALAPKPQLPALTFRNVALFTRRPPMTTGGRCGGGTGGGGGGGPLHGVAAVTALPPGTSTGRCTSGYGCN